jgi:hypothetical protein
MPSLFSECAIDGGLLTISRYPIAYQEFHGFTYPAVLSDALSYKGALYTKIELPSQNQNDKRHLHLFQTHTQASYYDSTLEMYVESFVCRFR